MYLAVMLEAAGSAAAVALIAVSPMYEFADLSTMMMSHVNDLPRVLGMSVAPSGLLPSDLESPTGSFI